jgi:putative ABC transport system substrate-binding protein
MKRRDFITLLGGAAAAWPLAVQAQQSARPVVAVLSGGVTVFPAFTTGLAEGGYQDSRNVTIEFHSGPYSQLREIARELATREVTVIAPWGIDAAQAAKEATSSIPIVFVFGVGPNQVRLRSQSQQARWQHHWHEPLHVRAARQTD